MRFKHYLRSSGSAAVGIALAGLASHASAVVLTQPGNFSNGNEVPALTNSTTGSIGSGSWQGDPSLTSGDGKQHLIYVQGGSPGPMEGGQKSYPAPGMNPRLLFPDDPSDPSDDVTLSDLVSLSFDTKTSDSKDWFVDIFTKPTGNGDNAGFYHRNYDLVVDNAANSGGNNGFTTHTLDKNGGTVYTQEDFDQKGDGTTLLSLDDLQSGDSADDSLRFIALGTGTNYDNFSGLLDNFQFSYQQDGNTISRTIDFEAQQANNVPAPSMLPLMTLALGLFGFLGLRRRNGLNAGRGED